MVAPNNTPDGAPDPSEDLSTYLQWEIEKYAALMDAAGGCPCPLHVFLSDVWATVGVVFGAAHKTASGEPEMYRELRAFVVTLIKKYPHPPGDSGAQDPST